MLRRNLFFLAALLCAVGRSAQQSGPKAPGPSYSALVNVKRIYVAELTGGATADALRELLISSLDSLKLFVLTDNLERADAVLRGGAEDTAFTDTFDSAESVNGRDNGGKYSSGASNRTRTGGGYVGISAGGTDAHHIKERKHEAYATVRLCSKDGDVLWSTTQESKGAKFRNASADVALKVARQLGEDFGKARQVNASDSSPANSAAAKP